MNRFIFLFASFCVLVSCVNHVKPTIDSAPVVVIFENPPIASVHFYKSGGYQIKGWQVSYIDFDGVWKTIENLQHNDTIVIKTGGRQYVELEHTAIGSERFYYYLQIGDTVKFSYDSCRIPHAQSNLDEKHTFMYNVYVNRRMRFTHDKMSIIGLANADKRYQSMFWLKHNAPIKFEYVFGNSKADYINLDSVESLAKYQYCLDRYYFDSLFSCGLIQTDYYNHIRYLQSFDSLIIWNDQPRGEFGKPCNIDFLQYPDSLLLRSSFVVQLFLWFNIDIFNGFINNNRLTPIEVFDTVYSITYYSNTIKNHMLYFCLNNLLDDCNTETIRKYAQKYLLITSDTAKYEFFIKSNRFDCAADNLELSEIYGSRTNLDSLLAQNRGKVIYVDFWASSCAPCCAGMPAAKKLRAEYANKDVVFLYLALDKEAPWRKAIASLEMADANSLNYLITNFRTSKMLEELKVQSIPRYLLYNRQGQLVHANAPRPESEEIRGLLDKYLAE